MWSRFGHAVVLSRLSGAVISTSNAAVFQSPCLHETLLEKLSSFFVAFSHIIFNIIKTEIMDYNKAVLLSPAFINNGSLEAFIYSPINKYN